MEPFYTAARLTLAADQEPMLAKFEHAWVHRYFFPLLDRFCARLKKSSLRCLHFGPDGGAEVEAVRAAGHQCESAGWDGRSLDAGGSSFDLVFGGRFGVLASQAEMRRLLAAELDRVTNLPGAILLTLANSRSLVDLSGNAGWVHAPGHAGCVGLDEARQLFLASGLFGEIRLLSLAGHFGWTRLPLPMKLLQPCFERYVAWASDPANPARYAGPANPVMNLWIER